MSAYSLIHAWGNSTVGKTGYPALKLRLSKDYSLWSLPKSDIRPTSCRSATLDLGGGGGPGDAPPPQFLIFFKWGGGGGGRTRAIRTHSGILTYKYAVRPTFWVLINQANLHQIKSVRDKCRLYRPTTELKEHGGGLFVPQTQTQTQLPSIGIYKMKT